MSFSSYVVDIGPDLGSDWMISTLFLNLASATVVPAASAGAGGLPALPLLRAWVRPGAAGAVRPRTLPDEPEGRIWAGGRDELLLDAMLALL